MIGVMARACYYDHAPGIPAQAVEVADANRYAAGRRTAVDGMAGLPDYRDGREEMADSARARGARLGAGAIPLSSIAARIASPGGAALAAALYLFLPYGIVASRNFSRIR